MPEPKDYELEYNSEPVCPYCGTVQQDAWEIPINYDGDMTTTECDKCEREFYVLLHLEPEYSTRKIEKETKG